MGAQGRSGGIVYFDQSGKQTRFIDTGKYMPAHICFDGNQWLWTFGWQRDSENDDNEERRDYMIFRKYSPEGKEMGRYMSRTLFPSGPPGTAAMGAWKLRAANDRIGALGYSGDHPEVWIELGLDGSLIGKWPLGRYWNGGTAYTSDGRLYRQVFGANPKLECYDRASSAWKDAGKPPVPGLLLGAENEELVFSQNQGLIKLVWAKLQ
jgi:hypothetical protein